jgi:pyruvate-ferredoxin/flavodoxin oxidoreductase
VAPAPAAASAVGVLDAPIYLDPADQARCTDCGTCYQELPQLFRKVTVVADGEARAVAELVPGALDGLDVTPELRRRMDRVKATCDAEIIR